MVAEAYHRDNRTKLVNLGTRLCGQAYFFIGCVKEISNRAMQILLNSWYDVSHHSKMG